MVASIKNQNLRAILYFVCCLFLIATGHAVERQKVSLSGIWDFKWDNETRLSLLPDDSNWEKIEVGIISQYITGFGKDNKNHWAWYRRNVRVPASMNGEQIRIRFSQVRFKTIVFWNGEKVGEHADGYNPFEIDVTDKVNFDDENELLVGVIDRIAFQRPDALPYSILNAREDRPEKDPVWEPPFGSLLNCVYKLRRPIGGIVDHVDLVSYPKVYIDDFHITTSVRQSNCMVEVSVSNNNAKTGNLEAAIVILDKGKIVQRFPGQSFLMKAGETKKLLFNTVWADAHYWSHEDPYLYNMVLSLQNENNTIDEINFRFGFREYWIEGTQFYLNGKLFKSRRNHFNYGDSYEDAKKYMSALKSINVNQIRLHHTAAPEWILDYADEIGMTLIPESAFYSRTRWYDIDNPEMWENAKNHWKGIVKSAKNHPSVVMYSVENEMQSTGSYLVTEDPAKWDRYVKNWAKVGQHIQSLDPTKPIQFSWAKDVGGWADIANLHYQRYIEDFFQYPNDLYWLESEHLTQRKGYGPNGEWRGNYIWMKDKPLILGEFGYQHHANPPHGLTSFIGDDAYIGNNWYKTWVWCLTEKYNAYKYSGVTAHPWMFTSDKENLYKLEDVFVKNWMSNFYGGEKLRKEIIVLNEGYSAAKLSLRITLGNKQKTYFKRNIPIQLQEGGKWEQEISILLPKVTQRVNANLNMKLVKQGKIVETYSLPIHIFPRIPNIQYQTEKVGLYDPHGKSLRELTLSGFVCSKITDITNDVLSNLQVLIIGKDALTLQFDKKRVIDNFVKQGGRTIFLEQSLVPNISWTSFRLEIDKNHSSTIAFKGAANHPILDNIENDDLKYWRGNHQVSKYNFVRPGFWNYNTIAYVGGGHGINHSPLLTLSRGKGLYIFSQFVLSHEMSHEPAALLLFNNILKHALDYIPVYRKAGVFASTESYLPEILADFGAEVTNFQNFPPKDLNSYEVLFFDGSVDLAEYQSVLEEFLARGGKIVFRELTPQSIKNVVSILPSNVTLKTIEEPELYDSTLVDFDAVTISYSPTRDQRIATTPYSFVWENEEEMKEFVCPMRAYKSGANELLNGITNTDLYWRKDVKYLRPFGKEIAPVASYSVEGDGLVSATKPAIIATIPCQKGEIIIDQIDWKRGLKETRGQTRRIISNFINNLKIKMKPYNVPGEE